MIKRKVSVIGLGYVGLPVAVAFEEIGFDINKSRVEALISGHDETLEVSDHELENVNILYTDKVDDLKKANFYIIAVPIPIDKLNKPNLIPLLQASKQ